MMPTLLEVDNVIKYFPVVGSFFEKFFSKEKKFVHAVDGVTLDIRKGQKLSLVGESGCGKTTCGKLIVKLLESTAGTIRFMGQDITKSTNKDMKKLRSKMQMVFQDAAASLNPRKTVYQMLCQPYLTHHLCAKDEVEGKVLKLMELIGLTPAEEFCYRYPHELSGGQKQRVCIGRATAVKPDLMVLDEPTSGLDVSMRASILNHLKDLQQKMDLSYLFITHDLAMVRSISDNVAVMYLGKIVELAEVGELFKYPVNPYTKSLLSVTPIPHPRRSRNREMRILKGDVPSPIYPPSGCRFHTRCIHARPECSKSEPKLVEVSNNHFVACHVMI